jgi:hypothetical protein
VNAMGYFLDVFRRHVITHLVILRSTCAQSTYCLSLLSCAWVCPMLYVRITRLST